MTLLLSLLLVSLVPSGQPGQPGQPGDDPIARHLFPPELVMKHSQALGLDDAQRDAIKASIQKAQAAFLDLQWDMQAEAQKLSEALAARPIDEAKALAQLDRVLDLERRIKKAQISLLVRIKNQLSERQQQQLAELR